MGEKTLKQYTPVNLVKMFWKSIILIFVLAICGGVIMGLIGKHKQSTTYTSTQSLLISHNVEQVVRHSNENQDPLMMADLNMMKTYSQIAESSEVITGAHKQLPKKIRKEYSINDMENAIKAKTHDQSLVLTISAKSSNKNASMEMSNAVSQTLKNNLNKYQPGSGTVHILTPNSKRNVSSETTPHLRKYVAVGVALGGIIGIVISFVAITLKDMKRIN